MDPREADGRSFTTLVEAVAWGRSVYTLVRIPAALAEAAAAAGTRRVAGTIDDVAVNLAVTRAPVVDGPFLWAGRSLLRRLGVEAGAVVECRLAPIADDEVLLPDDVAERLDAAGLRARWEGLPAADRRRRLYPVESAGRAATRAVRIEALVAALE